MADVAAARPAIDATGTPVAFVHMATPEEADPWFERADLGDVLRVSDPEKAHFRAFGLGTTNAGELVNPKIWARGAVCALSHGFGMQPADALRQLPGVFVVHEDRVLAEYRHRSPSDRPDYLALIAAARSGPGSRLEAWGSRLGRGA
jgi:hypothetical protein